MFPHTGWNCREGPRTYGAMQIDAGLGQVVVADRYKRAYFLSGVALYRLGRIGMKHVSVGAGGVWGSCQANKVYKYVAGDFSLANGNYNFYSFHISKYSVCDIDFGFLTV